MLTDAALLATRESFHVTGLPALLIIVAFFAALIGIGVLIGKAMTRRS